MFVLQLVYVLVFVFSQAVWASAPTSLHDREGSVATQSSILPPPVLMFDVDETICVGLGSSLAEKVVQEAFPDWLFLNYFGLDGTKRSLYAFFPDFFEALMIMHAWGFESSFFSAGGTHRNESLLLDYIQTSFEKNGIDIIRFYDAVSEENRQCFNIFSFDHMTKCYDLSQGYDVPEKIRGQHCKKDLSRVLRDRDANHAVIVENTPACVTHEQYPFIFLGVKNAADFIELLVEKSESLRGEALRQFLAEEFERKGLLSPVDFAAYTLGIVAECRDKMLASPGLFFKSALEDVMKVDHPVLWYSNSRVKSVPWQLNPNRQDHPHKARWIERGRFLLHGYKARKAQKASPAAPLPQNMVASAAGM